MGHLAEQQQLSLKKTKRRAGAQDPVFRPVMRLPLCHGGELVHLSQW